jgi:hypothetical protein
VPISTARLKAKQVVDLERHIIINEPPNFGLTFTKVQHGPAIAGWSILAELIKSKQHHKPFWEFVDRLKGLRYTYNSIVDKKFKALSRKMK